MKSFGFEDLIESVSWSEKRFRSSMSTNYDFFLGIGFYEEVLC